MKRVCVIGGGVAGIAVVKELAERGLHVDAYEMMPRTGGVFASNVWSDGRLTSSSVFTWYSQFPAEDRQKFFTWREMLDYLDRYCEHFGLSKHIHLDCRVEKVERLGAGGWRVRVHKKNWSNGHPHHQTERSVQESTFEESYDHVVICSGLHHSPRVPALPGADTFRGEQLQSSQYRDAELYRGRRIVVVGAGESGSDIARQLAEVGASCTISMRSAPGTLFPRWIQGNTPDIRDDRLTYNLPRVLAPLVLNRHRAFYHQQKERPELFRWAADSNYSNNRCSFNTNACKSFGIGEAILDFNATVKGPIARFEGEEVVFDDGSRQVADLVVYCTGFERKFPFLDEELSRKLVGLDRLWKNVVHDDLGDTMMLVGFSRPQQINLVAIIEMQARLVGEILGGKGLPSREHRIASGDADRAWMARYYGDRFQKNPALVDYLYYMDGVAKYLGCSVPFGRALLVDPHLWLKLNFSSMNGAHYRLVGVGSDWAAAARTIKQTPQFGNWGNALARWALGVGLTLYATVRGLVSPQWRSIHRQARP